MLFASQMARVLVSPNVVVGEPQVLKVVKVLKVQRAVIDAIKDRPVCGRKTIHSYVY